MAIFEDVRLKFREKEYTIPSTDVLRCIAKIEDHLTLVQLGRFMSARDLPLAKISQAYGAMLRHAGAVVTDDEVYEAMFDDGASRQRATDAIGTLQMLMLPPAKVKMQMGKPEAAPTENKTG